MKLFPIRSPNWVKVREKCKTSYDEWVVPPSIDTLHLYLKEMPKNYSSVYSGPIIDSLLNQLKIHDYLFNDMSDNFKRRLIHSINHGYCGINRLDVDQGGDGLLVPSFVELMSECFFWIEDKEKVDLITESDKKIFYKYYWATELYESLIKEHMMDDIDKMEAS